MPKVEPLILKEIEDAFAAYQREVLAAGLKEKASSTYIRYVDQVVRWLNDDFVTGGTLPPHRRRRLPPA